MTIYSIQFFNQVYAIVWNGIIVDMAGQNESEQCKILCHPSLVVFDMSIRSVLIMQLCRYVNYAVGHTE